jgi:hypothetical protein
MVGEKLPNSQEKTTLHGVVLVIIGYFSIYLGVKLRLISLLVGIYSRILDMHRGGMIVMTLDCIAVPMSIEDGVPK